MFLLTLIDVISTRTDTSETQNSNRGGDKIGKVMPPLYMSRQLSHTWFGVGFEGWALGIKTLGWVCRCYNKYTHKIFIMLFLEII